MEKVRTENCTWKEEHSRLFDALLNGCLGRLDCAKLERAILLIAKLCVDVRRYPPGAYFASILQSNGKVSMARFQVVR